MNDNIDNYLDTDIVKAYLNEINKYKIYTTEEQKELAKKYNQGDLKAKQELIKSNLRFVVFVTKRFNNRLKSLDVLDIIQEGNLGLIRAIETYDPEQGALTSYAYDWIYQYIDRAIKDKNTTIRTSVNLQEKKLKYKKLINNYELNGRRMPSDKEICNILNITPKMLKKIRESYKFDTTSINQNINDEDNSELEDFISYENRDYEAIEEKLDNHLLFLTLKENLKPHYYYILYYTVLLEKDITLETIGKQFNLSRERVRQIKESVLKKIKNIMLFPNKYYKKTLDKYGTNYQKINPYPIEVEDVIKYLYIFNDLNQIEKQLYYFIYVLKNKFTNEDYCNHFNISLEELANLKNTLLVKINRLFENKEKYKNFKEITIKTYGTKIFNQINNYEIIDFERIKNIFSNLDYNGIVSVFNEEIELLSQKEKQLLERYFGVKKEVTINKNRIEEHINIQLFKTNSAEIPKNVLYKTLEKYSHEFTEEQILYLECFYFKRKEKLEFKFKYPNQERMINCWQLVEKLERLYFNINRLLENNFNKEKYLTVRDKLNENQIKYLDLFYGVEKEALTIIQISEMFKSDYIKTHDAVRNAREAAINFYCNRRIKKQVDKNLYIPYVTFKGYEFTEETRNLLKMYLIDNMNYEQISKITKLSQTRISNIIMDGLRRIDFYRFEIIPCNFISLEELDDFFNNGPIDFSILDKKIIKLKFIEYKDNDTISDICSISKDQINRIIAHFNKIYNKYLIRNVELSNSDILNEINTHHTVSILNNEEKEWIALYYGIKCAFNPEGKKLSANQIAVLKNKTKNIVYHTCLRCTDRIKLSKIGRYKAEFNYMNREDLSLLLDDNLLPINEKEKYIICSLLELKSHSYKSTKDLSDYYCTKESNIKRIYNRAIVNIRKYQNNEIDGTISYTAITSHLKYFSKSDKNFIEEYYKNGLSYEQIAKKYNLSRDKIIAIFNRIKVNLYELSRDIETKKFDFDYYEKAIKNPKLPFYGNLQLTTKIFDLYFGQSQMERKTLNEIIKELHLTVGATTVKRNILSLMLSVEKLKMGIEKNETYTYEQVLDYYNKNYKNMSEAKRKTYQRYFKKMENPRFNHSKYQNPTSDIIFDLIKEHNPNYFNLSTKTKEDILKLLKNNNIKISKSYRCQLMQLFNITEREIMNGKDINHVFRIINKLEKLKDKKHNNQKALIKE